MQIPKGIKQRILTSKHFNPILSLFIFYGNIFFKHMFLYSYISPFLDQKIKFANFSFLAILKKMTFRSIFLEYFKIFKQLLLAPMCKNMS